MTNIFLRSTHPIIVMSVVGRRNIVLLYGHKMIRLYTTLEHVLAVGVALTFIPLLTSLS